MIAYVNGTIIAVAIDYIIVEVNNTGYRVQVPARIFESARQGQAIELFTHQYVREDSLQLFGFSKLNELSFFEQLISVSGIGPKAGLALLSQFSVTDLQQSIISGDISLLTKVSGIGKKTAERLILELKGSLADAITDSAGSGQTTTGEAVAALEQLGYSSHEALAALQDVDRSAPVEAQIKQALTQLGQQ